MLTLAKVAVTGGISSGKSTVTQIFQKLGAYVVSADQITHQLLSTNNALSSQITSLLGTEILTAGKTACKIDRKKMARVVFTSPELLRKVEAIIHPKIFEEIERQWHDVAKLGKNSLFVVEMPLLFEAGWEKYYDATVAVVAPQEDAVRRFCEKTGYDSKEYERRAALQFTPATKAAKATYVIENMGSFDELEAKVASLYRLLSKGEDLPV